MTGTRTVLRFISNIMYLLCGPMLLLVPPFETFGLDPWPIGTFLNVIGTMALISLAWRHLRLEMEVRRLQGKRPVPYGLEDDWPPMPTRKELQESRRS
jgi:hypothetical protein